jgi:hypothetical protein
MNGIVGLALTLIRWFYGFMVMMVMIILIVVVGLNGFVCCIGR